MEEKGVANIKICQSCALEFHEVGAAIRHAMREYGVNGKIRFSHGYCLRHFEKLMKSYGMPDEDIRASLLRNKDSIVFDLEKHPDVMELYSKGIFTTEQLRNYLLSLKKSNDQITERFKTLAGIDS